MTDYYEEAVINLLEIVTRNTADIVDNVILLRQALDYIELIVQDGRRTEDPTTFLANYDKIQTCINTVRDATKGPVQ